MFYKERKQIKNQGKEMGKIVGYAGYHPRTKTLTDKWTRWKREAYKETYLFGPEKRLQFWNGHPIEK